MSGFQVEVCDLHKRYMTAPDQYLDALAGVSLTAPEASVGAVMGPSGSGKSTLLHLIGAMDAADSGSIRVGDIDVTALSRREQTAYRRRIGFVFQRFHLLAALTVADNVSAPVLPHRTTFDKHQRALELLAAVGLEGREQSLPSRLSGGQQQRVAIARALINQPGLLLADEPTGNLDSHTGIDIIDLLVRLRDEHGMTVLIATHDSAVASRCDYMIQLLDGEIEAQAPTT